MKYSDHYQIVSAPGGTNYYIWTVPGHDADGNPNMEIEVTYRGSAPRVVLLKSQLSGNPRNNLTDFRTLSLSPDNKTLYFETAAYVTENAIHAIDLASKKLAYVAPGELACVVLTGYASDGGRLAQSGKWADKSRIPWRDDRVHL